MQSPGLSLMKKTKPIRETWSGRSRCCAGPMPESKVKPPAVHNGTVTPGDLTNLAPDLHNLQRCRRSPRVTWFTLVQRECVSRTATGSGCLHPLRSPESRAGRRPLKRQHSKTDPGACRGNI